ncbi:MAG: Hsp20/alpha crystallin family protein [Solirubrobacteraceae bacterium]|nr:Hsp20/alpha crystallin family protein [Solirubrobacteraceae bacterium]
MATTMTRWRPFAELEDMRRRMERMFEDLGDGNGRRWTLAIDLVERDDRYVMRADVPGISPEDVKIEVDDDVLTVSAQHEESAEEQDGTYVRRERRYGSFSRSITLPKGVGPDDIEATCKDGVLEVSFPKPKEEERRPVTITPKAA